MSHLYLSFSRVDPVGRGPRRAGGGSSGKGGLFPKENIILRSKLELFPEENIILRAY